MNFEWDSAKSTLNFIRRGVSFERAVLVFGGPHLIRRDRRRDYGEDRYIAVGASDGICFTVVFTDRIDSTGLPIRRIISLRRSNRKERRDYEKNYDG